MSDAFYGDGFIERARRLQEEIDEAIENWKAHTGKDHVEVTDFTIRFNRTAGLPPCGCKGECFNAKHPELVPQRSCRWDR